MTDEETAEELAKVMADSQIEVIKYMLIERNKLLMIEVLKNIKNKKPITRDLGNG